MNQQNCYSFPRCTIKREGRKRPRANNTRGVNDRLQEILKPWPWQKRRRVSERNLLSPTLLRVTKPSGADFAAKTKLYLYGNCLSEFWGNSLVFSSSTVLITQQLASNLESREGGCGLSTAKSESTSAHLNSESIPFDSVRGP